MSQDRFTFLSVDVTSTLICVVGASYNPELVDALLESTCDSLSGHGVPAENVEVVRVPGSFEIPVVVNEMALSGKFHAVIALGVVIAGDTSHHELIGSTTAKALLDVATRTRTPVVNGILVVENEGQAEARILGDQARGTEFAQTALQMAVIKRSWIQS